MRLGAWVLGVRDGKECVEAHLRKGYRAAYCPDYIRSSDQRAQIRDLRDRCAEADIVIAEVGTWVNPLSRDPDVARAARAYIVDRLRVADALGARCCVNVIGSLSRDVWYGPHPDNFSDAFFEEAVAVYSGILREAEPRETTLSFEIMPYCFLDGVEGYERFLAALKGLPVSVHLDLANALMSPRTLYGHRALLDEVIERLGARVASVHMKDLRLQPLPFNTHIDEVMLGEGDLDLGYIMGGLNALSKDLPVMLEHYDAQEQYDYGIRYLKVLAETRRITL